MAQHRVISNPGPLPGRAASASAVAAKRAPAWKTVAPLSDELNSAVFACEEYFARAVTPAAEAAAEEPGKQRPIERLEELYQWYAGLEAREREGAGLQGGAVARLQAARRQCAALQEQLGEAGRGLALLEELHAEVESKTSALHAETEALLGEKKRLAALAAALHEHLGHFKVRQAMLGPLHFSSSSSLCRLWTWRRRR